MVCAHRKSLWAFCSQLAPNGHWAEFGVREGKSARFLLSLSQCRSLDLFDSWEGLPESWFRGDGKDHPAGALACEEPSFLGEPRVWKHRGLFVNTLPEWVSTQPEAGMIHLDCDIYLSTWEVLEALTDDGVLAPGAVLIFDDLFGYPRWREGQWRAWCDFRSHWDHEWVAHTPKGQAAVQIIGRR